MSFFARNNLAIAFQNYAVQKANEGEIPTALVYFDPKLNYLRLTLPLC